MATTSEVKTGLDEISNEIRNANNLATEAKDQLQIAKDKLDGLASTYADVISTINGYGTTDAFEALAKAERAKLTTEFQALSSAFGTAIDAL